MEIPLDLFRPLPLGGVLIPDGASATLRPRSAFIRNSEFLDYDADSGQWGVSRLGYRTRLRTSTRQQRVARRRAALSLDLSVIFDIIIKGSDHTSSFLLYF
jgi:hypothetical protein